MKPDAFNAQPIMKYAGMRSSMTSPIILFNASPALAFHTSKANGRHENGSVHAEANRQFVDHFWRLGLAAASGAPRT